MPMSNSEILKLEPNIYVRAQIFSNSFVWDHEEKRFYFIPHSEWVSKIVSKLLFVHGYSYDVKSSFCRIFKWASYNLELCKYFTDGDIREYFLTRVSKFQLITSYEQAGEWIAQFPSASRYLCSASEEIRISNNTIRHANLYTIACSQYIKDLSPVLFDALCQAEILKDNK